MPATSNDTFTQDDLDARFTERRIKYLPLDKDHDGGMEPPGGE
jgi:hypothetical protein